jgi:bifunctional DNA-binding transcriptional regulator/antitoxin component of YhaV-PrlF toxin-antitoxin module
MTTLTMTRRGGLTLPPDIRRRLGVDAMNPPLFIVEERDGGVFLQPAAALPVRDIPESQIRDWIQRDEADMTGFRKRSLRAP